MTTELIDRTKHFVRNARMCRCGWEGDDVTTHISDLLLAGVRDLVEPLVDALDRELAHEITHSDRVREAYNKVAATLGREGLSE